MRVARPSPPSRLRVLHLVTQLDVGGMEKLLVEFATRADRTRFELRFVVLRGRGAVADEIEALGWPVTTLDVPPGRKLSLLMKLRSAFRRFLPHVVHTHNALPLLYGGLAARLAAVERVVHTRHGPRPGQGPAWAFRAAAARADRVVCVSHDTRAVCAREGWPERRMTTIWNGIDARGFAGASFDASGPVVTTTRLSPEKGVDVLLQAAALVRRQQPLDLRIAGHGPGATELRTLADRLELSGAVSFLGHVADVRTVLDGASLFVLPSSAEGISLSLLEAMASGLPVVATSAGGNPEVVLDGETGLVVPADRPELMAARLLDLRFDPARAERMGRAGRERVGEHFGAARMVAAYEQLYAGLFGEAA